MSVVQNDEGPMRLAIEASSQALAEGNMPFGAVLVDATGRQRWTARNNQVSTGDCTGHAEMVLVREASASLGPQALRGGTVYASGEPCAMCAGAMFWAGIRRVVYAASQDAIAQALGAPVLPVRSAVVYAGAEPAVAVDGPLLAEEAIMVLKAAGGRGGATG